VAEAGWLDLPTTAGASTSLLCEAAYELHHRFLPLPVPLLELWLAADAAGEGAAPALLSVDDVLRPRERSERLTTGWVPAGTGDVLTLVDSSGGAEVRRAERARLEAVPGPRLDVTLPAVILAGDESEWTTVGELTAGALRRLQVRALCLQSAALVGQASALLDVTLTYLKDRHQFGVPIGSFQALKHRAVDVHTELYVAGLVAGFAAWAADVRDDAWVFATMAKAHCAPGAVRAAFEAVQLHGGIGFTWEGGVHYGVRRCAALALGGLNADECAEVAGAAVLAAPAPVWPGNA
jgi:hypothetical protein